MICKTMQHHVHRVLLACAAVFIAGCAGTTTVTIPPRVDLTQWPVIGMVLFTADNHEELAPTATQNFIMHMQSAQRGVRVLELGSKKNILQEFKGREFNLDVVKALGAKYGVQAILLGQLDVSEARPNFKISPDLSSASASASVVGELSAKLLETATGATVWSNGAHGKWSLAGATLGKGGLSNVGLSDAKDKYDEMLRELTRVATDDFRPTFEKRKVK